MHAPVPCLRAGPCPSRHFSTLSCAFNAHAHTRAMSKGQPGALLGTSPPFPVLLMHMSTPMPCQKASPVPFSAILRLPALSDYLRKRPFLTTLLALIISIMQGWRQMKLYYIVGYPWGYKVPPLTFWI